MHSHSRAVCTLRPLGNNTVHSGCDETELGCQLGFLTICFEKSLHVNQTKMELPKLSPVLLCMHSEQPWRLQGFSASRRFLPLGTDAEDRGHSVLDERRWYSPVGRTMWIVPSHARLGKHNSMSTLGMWTKMKECKKWHQQISTKY